MPPTEIGASLDGLLTIEAKAKHETRPLPLGYTLHSYFGRFPSKK